LLSGVDQVVDQVAYVRSMMARKLTHEVHQSELRSFRGCRRRWNWVFRDNYYPPLTPRPLEFGIAFHKCMEVLHRPETWTFDHNVLGSLAEKAFVDECKDQKQKYLDAKDLYALDDDQEHDYEERMALGRGMIWYYVKNKLPEIQQTYVPISVETSFHVPLMDDGEYIFCKCRRCRKDFARSGGGQWFGNPVVYSGRTDVIVHDMFGNYFIMDWKTAAAFRDIEEYLVLDIQVASYVMALRRNLGLNIQGFLYFELRKAFPEPPKLNTSIRLGRWYSVNKQQATDHDTYLATIKEGDLEGYESGAYDGFLAYLKASGTLFFRLTRIPKGDYELAQVEKNLVLEVRDMLEPNLRIYPAPSQFSCNSCAFSLPCRMKNTGEDYQYTLDTMYERREPYYRIKNKRFSTESRGGE
jgi:hypothetical protein